MSNGGDRLPKSTVLTGERSSWTNYTNPGCAVLIAKEPKRVFTETLSKAWESHKSTRTVKAFAEKALEFLQRNGEAGQLALGTQSRLRCHGHLSQGCPVLEQDVNYWFQNELMGETLQLAVCFTIIPYPRICGLACTQIYRCLPSQRLH